MSRKTSDKNKQKIKDLDSRTRSIIDKLEMMGSGIKDAPPLTDAERNHVSFCIGAVWMEMSNRLEGDLE